MNKQKALDTAMKAVGAVKVKGSHKPSPTDLRLGKVYIQSMIDHVRSNTNLSPAKAKRLMYAKQGLKHLDKKTLAGFDDQAKTKGFKNLESLLKGIK